MLQKFLSQKLLNLLGIASMVALVAALGLTTYLVGQKTRVPIGAKENCISFDLSQSEFPDYQESYTFDGTVCNISDGDTQISAFIQSSYDTTYINNHSGGLTVQTIVPGESGCKIANFTVNMQDVWTDSETQGTITTVKVYATSRNIGDWGCYKDIAKTITFGTAEATPTTCDSTTCSVGCCEDNTCYKYSEQSNNRCGKSGNACEICADGTQCASVIGGGYCKTPAATITPTPTPSDKPDLIIFDIVPSADAQKIEYTVKNIGGDQAGNNYSQLIVEGNKVSVDKVFYLDAGGKRRETFEDYSWVCTDEQDTIAVCADVYNTVDEGESGEKNNCHSIDVPCVASTPTLTPVPPTRTPGDSCKEISDDWVCWTAGFPCPGETQTPSDGTCYVDSLSSVTCCKPPPVCPTIAAPQNVGIQTAPPAAAAFRAFANTADMNSDGTIDGADASALVSSWGKNKGETGFNNNADLNNDGKVNAVDASILVSNWTK